MDAEGHLTWDPSSSDAFTCAHSANPDEGYVITIRNPRKVKVTVLNLSKDTEWYLAGAFFALRDGTEDPAGAATPLNTWESKGSGGTEIYLDRGARFVIEKTSSPANYKAVEPSLVIVTTDANGGVTVSEEGVFDARSNTLTFYDKSRVLLTIVKAVEGYQGDVTREFRFTLRVAGAAPEDTYAWVKYGADGAELARSGDAGTAPLANGGAFTLKHGERISIEAPVNKKITITEERGEYFMTAAEDRPTGFSGLAELDGEEDDTRIERTDSSMAFTMTSSATVIVTNDLRLAPLTVTKAVEDYRDGQPAQYAFTLQSVEGVAAGQGSYAWEKRDADGSAILDSAQAGAQPLRVGGTFTLTDGQSVTIYLPVEKQIQLMEAGYSIIRAQEEIVDGEESGLRLPSGAAEDDARITLNDRVMSFALTGAAKITVTNRIPTVPLTLTKVATGGREQDRAQTFTFQLQVEGDEDGAYTWTKLDGSGRVTADNVSAGYTLSSGYDFELKDGESIIIELPYEKKITITEEPGAYTMTAEEEIAAGEESGLQKLTAASGEDTPRIDLNGQTMEFTLTKRAKIVVTNEFESGAALTIDKSVTGAMGDLTKEFRFTLRGLPGDVASVTYKKYATTDGSTYALLSEGALSVSGGSTEPFLLKHDQRIVLEDLPEDTELTLVEENGYYTASVEEIYETSSNLVQPSAAGAAALTVTTTVGATGSTNAVFRLSADAELRFTNTLEAVSPTGVDLRYAPYMLMLLFGLFLLLPARRKRKSL